MQTRAQSSLEVGIDFGFSLLMNIGAQLLFYGALATAGRSLAVAALVLGLAIPRRYAIRRLFNALLPRNARQPRWQAWLEVGVDTVLGFCVAMVLQWLFYGAAATWAKAGGFTAVVYAITMGRRYLLRRLFDRWSASQEASHHHSPHGSGEPSQAPTAPATLPPPSSQKASDPSVTSGV
jgi:hypothetical protein